MNNTLQLDVRTPGERRLVRLAEGATATITDDELEGAYLVPDYDTHLMPDHATVYPPGDRLYWNMPGSAEAFEMMEKGYFAHPNHKYPLKTALGQLQMVNGTGRDIYQYANGERTGGDIYRMLLKKYNEPYGKHKQSIFDFMRGMVTRAHVEMSPEPQARPQRVTGSEDYYYPPHMSIEVTSNCNIRCIHCYGSFEQARFDALNADSLIRSLGKMKEEGLKQVELTGGECTTHPEFARIVEWCAENLQLVGVLTNANNIKDEVFEIIAGHARNTMVQICINGDEAYHDRFTKVKGSYRRALAAMTRLAQAGVAIRAPMNLTFENYMQVETTCMAVKDAGAMTFLANWVDVDYGRAQDLAHEQLPIADYAKIAKAATGEADHECEHVIAGLTCSDRSSVHKTVYETLDRLAATYPGFVKHKIEGQAKEMWDWEQTCGAGRRSLYMASNGRIGVCPMSVETGIPGFGTIDGEGSMVSVMDSEFAKHFATLPAPNPKDCTGCPHELAHRGCLLHGIMQFMKTPTTCQWGKNHNIQKLIDTGFHTLSKKPDGSWDLPDLDHFGTGCGHGGKSEPQVVQIGLLN
jgi:MoaA/NifB/PqqE/SkfB family radical SAM enzyme